MDPGELPPIAELVPHRGRVLLLDRLVEHDAEGTVARVVVGARGWLSRSDGSAPPWLALEYMAQCAAAHEGMLARSQGRDLGPGFLVAAMGVRLYQASLCHGECLRVRARRTRGRPGLGALSHTCSIDSEGSPGSTARLAEGRLSMWIRPLRASDR